MTGICLTWCIGSISSTMSDYQFSPGMVVIPTNEYLDELRKRVCGDPHQLAAFQSYLTMISELSKKLEQGDPQPEIEKLAQRLESLRHELDGQEGMIE